MTMSPFKRALIRGFAKTADSALVAASKRQQAARADDAADADPDDPSDCLPCKAMERRRRAEAAVRGEPLEQ